MASNKSFVSSPMVDDCDSFISDVSVNSKPSVTQLYAVNDEAFMVDKKYVNDVFRSEAKTSAAIASVVIKEVGSDNVDLNTDEVVADEDVDLAGNNVFVADKKSVLVDEDVDFCEKNYVVSEQKMFIGDEDVEFAQNNYVVLNCSDAKRDKSGDADMNNYTDIQKFAADANRNGFYFKFIFDCWILIDDAFMVDKKYVNITDLNLSSDEKVSISDRDDLKKKFLIEFKDVYGSEAKTYVVVDSVVIKEVGSDNVDVNTNDVVANEDVDLAADADLNDVSDSK
ncbi:hypothetical protein Tco_0717321 [Tanacetum coccineum]